MPDEPRPLDAPKVDAPQPASEAKPTMTVHCPGCGSRYEINAAAARPALKVRCPRCKAVFPVPSQPLPAEAASEARPARQPAKITDPRLARRLARNMLSEIVLNRPGQRERARDRGTLLSTFGPALIEAYRIYGGKVSPGLTDSRAIFRDAVNEILGDGTPIL